MNSKLVFKFHTRSADEILIQANDPDEASQQLRDFLGDEPGAHRHITAIRIRTEIPRAEHHRDFEWDDPTMTQVIRAWYSDWQLLDIAEFGIEGAWPRFTTQQDAALFYDRFEDEVFVVLDRMAERSGIRDVLHVLEKHTNLEVHSAEEWKNAAAWVVIEQTIHDLLDDLAQASENSRVTAEPVSV